MSCRIVCAQGVFYGYDTVFSSKEDALGWIESNTGLFETGDYIAIVDFDEFKSTFMRMELRQVPVIID